MDNSILRSTKKVLGIAPDDETFDLDILTFINSALTTIQQLGIGQTFQPVEDDSTTWQEFCSDERLVSLIRTIVYLRVRMLFDPPNTSYTQSAMNTQIEELEWRLNVWREDSDWVDPMGPLEAA